MFDDFGMVIVDVISKALHYSDETEKLLKVDR